jgi:hypothetical protein
MQPPDTLAALAGAVAETPGARVWLHELLAALSRRATEPEDRKTQKRSEDAMVGSIDSKLH